MRQIINRWQWRHGTDNEETFLESFLETDAKQMRATIAHTSSSRLPLFMINIDKLYRSCQCQPIDIRLAITRTNAATQISMIKDSAVFTTHLTSLVLSVIVAHA